MSLWIHKKSLIFTLKSLLIAVINHKFMFPETDNVINRNLFTHVGLYTIILLKDTAFYKLHHNMRNS